VIKYKRKDGVELSGTLYLPVGYDKPKKKMR
jgi:dipeptidyl aminopeptidase/acylaminoacyl peptidase